MFYAIRKKTSHFVKAAIRQQFTRRETLTNNTKELATI